MHTENDPTTNAVYSPENILDTLQKGDIVDLSHLNRSVRLKIINNFLESENLRSLEGLGDASRGEMEFTGINKYSPDRFVARIDFQCKAGENEFNHLNFISANTATSAGAIIVPILCSKDNLGEKLIVLNQQFRPVLGRSTIEITRGFPDENDFAQSKPVQNALKELKEETAIEVTGDNYELLDLGEVYENTGTHNVKNSLIGMSLSLDPEELNAINHRVVTEKTGHQISTLLTKPADAFKLVEDNHSLAILGKLMQHFPDLFS